MTTQLSFFDIQKPKPTGEILRDKGIQKAIQHAEDTCDQWQIKALAFLEAYAMNHHRFSG